VLDEFPMLTGQTDLGSEIACSCAHGLHNRSDFYRLGPGTGDRKHFKRHV
jgi:hypothetical protein